MRGFALLLLLVIAITLPASAQWRENEKPAPDTPWAKSDGDFGAMFAFTDKPDELYAAWEKEGPGVRWSQTSTAARNIPIAGVIFFTGCAANADGNCDLIARFTTFTPSEKQWGDPVDAEIWVGHPPSAGNALQLSQGNMGLIVDPGDELGTYTTKVELTDRVSKKKMRLERQFTAVEAPAKK
jgi:hypothetical protein